MKEEQIFINDLKINYKIFGGGEPLLILHGWGGSSDSWIEVSEILAKNTFKVICPDLPGFGKSLSPPSAWTVKDYANFIFAFLEKLELKKTNLLGHSFGGRISIKLAVLYPQKIKKLILCASAGIKHKLNFFQKIVLNLALIGNFLFSRRPLKRFKDVARNIFYMFLRSKDYTKAKGAMKETLKKVLSEDLTPEFSQIKAKTLLVWGGKDKTVPIQDAYLMKEKISNSALKIIPKAAHTPNLEFPQKMAEIITEFLKT